MSSGITAGSRATVHVIRGKVAIPRSHLDRDVRHHCSAQLMFDPISDVSINHGLKQTCTASATLLLQTLHWPSA